MTNLKDLPVGPDAPRVVNAIIEIPKGSRNKYEYDIELGVMKLNRVLYSSIHYPAAYGFVPSTLWDDGDPMDILIFINEPLATGVLVEAKPIGILRMRDEKENDDKLLAIAMNDPTYRSIRDIKDVPEHMLLEIEYFFQTYKKLEHKHVESLGWDNVLSAQESIRRAQQLYQQSQKKRRTKKK
ncbi:MAG: inorganic diphosphatase [Acidobacteriota bacterium]